MPKFALITVKMPLPATTLLKKTIVASIENLKGKELKMNKKSIIPIILIVVNAIVLAYNLQYATIVLIAPNDLLWWIIVIGASLVIITNTITLIYEFMKKSQMRELSQMK